MWCEKCHNGSDTWNSNNQFSHCGQCGSSELTEKNPFPSKGRSIRAMNKRVKDVKDGHDKRESKSSIHDEVEAIVGTLKGKDYSKGQ